MYHPGCTTRQNRYARTHGYVCVRQQTRTGAGKRDPIAPELQNLQKLFQN
jgi:hypothetical protein